MIAKNNNIDLIVCGGSGQWAEKNHYPSILSLKSSGVLVRVVAIFDPVSPYKPEKNEKRVSLNKLLELDRPLWIDTTKKNERELLNELNKLIAFSPACALVVATNPTYHYVYCKWGLMNGVPIICDKPLVTVKNSAFEPSRAKLIQKQYDELYKLYQSSKLKNPHYIFCSPLRRRALTPFIEVAQGIESVHAKTHEGIRCMNVTLNGGIHKYPAEYTKGGAHGHLDGVGTLSHSSYHYIDVIAWYLMLARGTATSIDMSLTYVLRVGEYLKTCSYRRLRELIEAKDRNFDDDVSIPPEVLNSELDFSFSLKLLDDQNNTVGNVHYIVNYSSFAPRVVAYDPEVTEYAHDKKGGRMSSVYFDIHQGPLQQWQIIKNDEVAKGHNLELRHNIHPHLGRANERQVYKDTYEKGTLTSQNLFEYFIKSCLKQDVSTTEMELLSTIETQALTSKLYSMMYEKIAEEFYNKNHPRTRLRKSSIINLRQYL